MTDELTPTPQTDALATVPSQGHQFTREDLTLPRLAIAQKTSPQLESDKVDYIPGLKLFELFNTGTNEIYGMGPVEFVVLRIEKRAMQFDNNNKVIAMDVPLNDPRLQWRTAPDGTRLKPEAVLFYDYLILFTKSKMPAVLSLKSTNMRAAKKFNTKLELHPKPWWLQTFTASSVKGTTGSFSYGMFRLDLVGETSNEMKQVAARAAAQLAGVQLKTEPDRDERPTVDPDTVPF